MVYTKTKQCSPQENCPVTIQEYRIVYYVVKGFVWIHTSIQVCLIWAYLFLLLMLC